MFNDSPEYFLNATNHEQNYFDMITYSNQTQSGCGYHDKMQCFSISFVSSDLLMIMPSDDCHGTLLIINIGSRNGFVPSGNKSLHEPMLNQICVSIWCNQATVCYQHEIDMNIGSYFPWDIIPIERDKATFM